MQKLVCKYQILDDENCARSGAYFYWRAPFISVPGNLQCNPVVGQSTQQRARCRHTHRARPSYMYGTKCTGPGGSWCQTKEGSKTLTFQSLRFPRSLSSLTREPCYYNSPPSHSLLLFFAFFDPGLFAHCYTPNLPTASPFALLG